MAMLLLACKIATPQTATPQPPSQTTQSPQSDKTQAPPDENIGGVVLEWLADPGNAALAVVAVGGEGALDDLSGVGILNDPFVIASVTGISLYAGYQNREEFANAAIAIVEGAQGFREWVQDNFEIAVPLQFSPDGGEVSIQTPGVNFSGFWNKTATGGCNYHGTLNGVSLESLDTPDPCDPRDYLAWVGSQLKEMRKHIGERADELMRALMDLIQPFAR